MRTSGPAKWRRSFLLNKPAVGARVCCLLLAVAAAAAQAGQFAGAGERLQLLKKIQGVWQSGCYAVVRDEQTHYQRDLLTFSYTHLSRQTTEYADRACQNREAKRADRYAFTLGEVVLTSSDDRALALNLTAQTPAVITPPLHAANLIDYDVSTGSLLLGQPALQEPQQRLTALDRALAFRRR